MQYQFPLFSQQGEKIIWLPWEIVFEITVLRRIGTEGVGSHTDEHVTRSVLVVVARYSALALTYM